MTKTALIVVAIVAAFGSAARAQPMDSTPSIRVSFADLDLAQKSDRTTLETRVAHAVSRLCETPSAVDLDAMSRYRACRRAAWSGARLQLTLAYDAARHASQPTDLAAR